MNVAQQLELLVDRCVDVIARDELAARLADGKPLRVKLGIDPSGPLLHLGHAVVLRKLRQFQDLGHQAILIVGDFTARIGDPTGLSASRKPRTQAEISADMRTYAAQAALILDMDKAVVRYNSEWLAPISFGDVIKLSASVTVARMLERDDFSKRFKKGAPIGLHEFLYPLSQAYDSVATQADIELGGTEQLFNLLMGRRLQEEEGQRPQICMTLPILEGTDGVQRMGKSLDNYIALQDEPSVIFGKVMSIPDQLIARYWQLATTRSKAEYEAVERAMQTNELSARDTKVQLAGEIVGLYHGQELARSAQEHFEKTVVRKELPDDLPALALPDDEASLPLGSLLVKLGWAASNREAARLVRQGAIKVDGKRIEDEKHRAPSWRDKVLQKGNHQFARLVAADKR